MSTIDVFCKSLHALCCSSKYEEIEYIFSQQKIPIYIILEYLRFHKLCNSCTKQCIQFLPIKNRRQMLNDMTYECKLQKSIYLKYDLIKNIINILNNSLPYLELIHIVTLDGIKILLVIDYYF